MLHGKCLTLALFVATIIAAALAGSASARDLSLSTQTVRATWARLTFIDPLEGTTVCPVTLEGTLHNRTFIKGRYNLVGNVTGADIGLATQCTGGESTILKETLPWSLRYLSFEGRLPDITNTRLLLAGSAFKIHSTSLGAPCLFTTRETTREHGLGTLNRNTATGALETVDLSGSITSNEGCALGARITARISGRSTSMTVLNSTTRITLTLI